MVQALTPRQGRIWTSQTGWINEDIAIILGGFLERLRMNYSTEETRDDEDRQSEECGPEVSHPRSVTYRSFYCVRSYVLANWTPTCQLLRNGILGNWEFGQCHMTISGRNIKGRPFWSRF